MTNYIKSRNSSECPFTNTAPINGHASSSSHNRQTQEQIILCYTFTDNDLTFLLIPNTGSVQISELASNENFFLTLGPTQGLQSDILMVWHWMICFFDVYGKKDQEFYRVTQKVPWLISFPFFSLKQIVCRLLLE